MADNKESHDEFKVLKGKTLKPRILYSKRLSSRIGKRDMNFSEQQNWKNEAIINLIQPEPLKGDLNTLLTLKDRYSDRKATKQKWHDRKVELSWYPRDTTDGQKNKWRKNPVNTLFFSSTHGTFSRIDHIVKHKQASIDLRGCKLFQTFKFFKHSDYNSI